MSWSKCRGQNVVVTMSGTKCRGQNVVVNMFGSKCSGQDAPGIVVHKMSWFVQQLLQHISQFLSYVSRLPTIYQNIVELNCLLEHESFTRNKEACLHSFVETRAVAILFGAPVQHLARGPWPCKCNLEICLYDFSNEAFYYRDIYLAQFVEACMHDQTRVPHSGLLGGEKFSEIVIWCTFWKQFVLFILRCKSNY